MRNEASRSAESSEPGARRPYEKPAIEFIELHGDEVLSDSCKTGSISGQGAAPCGADQCSSLGGS